jgi:hypothetical protein
MSGGYAVAQVPKRLRRHGTVSSNKINVAKQKTMKLSIKQKIRNWLMNDDNEYSHSITIDDSGPNIQSQGFRLNVYGASGGTIVETTKYDRKHDENRNSLHVITEDKDLGEELSKIITMEQLR